MYIIGFFMSFYTWNEKMSLFIDKISKEHFKDRYQTRDVTFCE